MTAVDVEALHPSSGRRSAGLRLCVFVSAGALLACSLGVSLAASVFVLRIHGDLEKKMPNTAHLEGSSTHLHNMTLEWRSENLGSRFNYSKQIHTLEVTDGGMYLMYLNLGVYCPSDAARSCGKTSIVVNVKNKRSSKLDCRMELPASHSLSKVHRCLAVVMLESHERLLVNMIVTGDNQDWKLDQSDTKFGLVPVGQSMA